MTISQKEMQENRAILRKVPYTLLELINNESTESVDYIISNYLLHHMTNLQEPNIQEIADACAVSKSTISRFCRRAGLETFQELKTELATFHSYRDVHFNVSLEDENGTYLQKVASLILNLDKSLDYDAIRKLAQEIYHHENVHVMGSMQAMNPASNLQQDLFASNKIARAPGAYILKEEAISKAKKDDLFIIFSNSGEFFERLGLQKKNYRKLNDLTIWMITGNQEAIHYPYINQIIYTPNNHSYVSHPIQFNLIESIIAIAYAEYCRKVEEAVTQ